MLHILKSLATLRVMLSYSVLLSIQLVSDIARGEDQLVLLVRNLFQPSHNHPLEVLGTGLFHSLVFHIVREHLTGIHHRFHLQRGKEQHKTDRHLEVECRAGGEHFYSLIKVIHLT